MSLRLFDQYAQRERDLLDDRSPDETLADVKKRVAG